MSELQPTFKKELKLQVRETYGVRRIYPMCQTSTVLCKFKKAKSLTGDDLQILKKMGFSWTFIPLHI